MSTHYSFFIWCNNTILGRRNSSLYFSVNHGICTYDLTKRESPLITLRPIAVNSSIGELLWIYQNESNNLDLLKEKYGVTCGMNGILVIERLAAVMEKLLENIIL